MEKDNSLGQSQPGHDDGEVEASVAESDKSSCGTVSFAAMLASLNQGSELHIHRYAEDNFSLEVNFGDGGSCQLSDVSSISCQNVTQDDLDSLDCDSGTAAKNSIDSNSERSDSPVDFDNDRDDEVGEGQYSNCLEAELQLKVAEQLSGLKVPAMQEEVTEFSSYGDSTDTGTMKRRFRDAEDHLGKNLPQSDVRRNDCLRSEDLGLLINCEQQDILAKFNNCVVDNGVTDIVSMGQEADDENDGGPYRYSPPVGLTLNGLSGGYVLSRSNDRSSSDNCYVTLEFNKAFSERAIAKMKKSPGLARRIGDLCPQVLLRNGKIEDLVSGVRLKEGNASVTDALGDMLHPAGANVPETSEKLQPCIMTLSENSSKKRSDVSGLMTAKEICNGISETQESDCVTSLQRIKKKKVPTATLR